MVPLVSKKKVAVNQNREVVSGQIIYSLLGHCEELGVLGYTRF